LIIYNVTTKVDKSIADDWLKWLKQEHAPELIETGCFSDATILQLLEVDDTEGPTYTVQYKAQSETQYHLYLEKFAPILREKSFAKWGNKFIAFRSLMQVVQ
jgi:hypothetical protein